MSEASTAPGPDPRHAETLRVVERALGQIRYGSILITIHQGEVTAIETSTKVRPKPPRQEAQA